MKLSQNDTAIKSTTKAHLLEVSHLSLSFLQYEKGLKETNHEVISDFNLTINEGEIVAVVGASGSGKSLLADAILGILPEGTTEGGMINFCDEELTEERKIQLRGKEIALIPQTLKALDPLMKVGKQVQAAIPGKKKKAIQQEAFRALGLPASTGNKLPHELSGGMARRVLISIAMVSDASLIIADEPTPGLDEATREKTISHIEQLAADDKGVMFISHDINAALQIADKIVVVRAGETIDVADTEDFSGEGENLNHPYTKALWNALPQNNLSPINEPQQSPSETSSEPVIA